MYCTSVVQTQMPSGYLLHKYDYFSLFPHHSLQTHTHQLYNADLANFCPPQHENNTYDEPPHPDVGNPKLLFADFFFPSLRKRDGTGRADWLTQEEEALLRKNHPDYRNHGKLEGGILSTWVLELLVQYSKDVFSV